MQSFGFHLYVSVVRLQPEKSRSPDFNTGNISSRKSSFPVKRKINETVRRQEHIHELEIDLEVGSQTMSQMVHSRVKMRNFRALLFPLLLGLSCAAFAQVYKSTDAEGNVTYSDTPSTGDEAVQVEKTNVADPVNVQEDEAFVPASEPEPKAVKQQAPPQPEPSVNADDDDNHYVAPRAVRRSHHLRREHRHR